MSENLMKKLAFILAATITFQVCSQPDDIDPRFLWVLAGCVLTSAGYSIQLDSNPKTLVEKTYWDPRINKQVVRNEPLQRYEPSTLRKTGQAALYMSGGFIMKKLALILAATITFQACSQPDDIDPAYIWMFIGGGLTSVAYSMQLDNNPKTLVEKTYWDPRINKQVVINEPLQGYEPSTLRKTGQAALYMSGGFIVGLGLFKLFVSNPLHRDGNNS